MEAVHRNILTRLVGLGLVSESAVVDGSVILGTGRQRNRFYYCRRREAPSFFMKQTCGESGAEKSLLLETKVYQCAAAHPDCAELRLVMPHLIHFDEESSMLITEMFTNSEDMSTAMRRTGRLELPLIRAFGAAAARIHSASTAPFQAEEALFDGKPHWIHRLHDNPSPLPSLRARSQASAQLIDELLADHALMNALARQRETWRTTHMIHGDYKWENAIVLHDADKSVRIIDWEQANVGDPAWDIGYGFAAILVHAAIATKGARDDTAPAKRTAAMQCFWQGYVEQRRADDKPDAEFLHRAIAMMAARLLVAAFELCYAESDIPAISRGLLRDARNLFEDGGDEVARIIGATPAGERSCTH